MPRFRLFAVPALAFALALTTPASAQQAGIRESPPRESPLATDVPDSAATKVFVLGTPHLSAFSDRFEPAMVDSLVTLLGRFGPDAIGVEKIPGRQAAAMERWGGNWDPIVQRFAGAFLYHGHQIQRQAGWSWSEANQRADSLLTVARLDSVAISTESRLTLLRSLTAAYRFPSAVLQWRYLPPEVRSAQTAVPDTTVRALNKSLRSANEVYSIGVRLAHRLGHQRLYPIDHQAENDQALSIYSPLMDAIGDSLGKALDTDPVLRRADSLEKAALNEGELLPLYRYLNQEKVGRADVEAQWHTMLEADVPGGLGLQWLRLWESRNLHSVGHIQRILSQHPGGRVLVIVGSSHKPFFDAYLRQMMGVKVVEANEIFPGL